MEHAQHMMNGKMPMEPMPRKKVRRWSPGAARSPQRPGPTKPGGTIFTKTVPAARRV